MKLYVWEGNGVSAAYHDDGTLVVLAESPEQAREVMRRGVEDREAQRAEFERQRDAYIEELRAAGVSPHTPGASWTTTDRGREIWAMWPTDSEWFDGSLSALDREPDRVVDTDQPAWVAFNGGGYD